MDKKFGVEKAFLNCQQGSKLCKLKPFSDRHIYGVGLLMANESDIGAVCCGESAGDVSYFGTCRSPFCDGAYAGVNVAVSNIQQIAALGGLKCEINVLLPWQSINKYVHMGIEGYGAVMEDSWTICHKGLGIISLVSSGQEDEDAVLTMLQRIDQLEMVVDAYMQTNGIKSKHKESIMESVMLWNGYKNEDIFWDYKSNETNRTFVSYLEKEDPSLFNYFERGLYLKDKEGETIDLSYMMGIHKATNEKMDYMECISKTMTEDRGMYNGYLEAGQQGAGKGSTEMLKDYLKYSTSAEYDGHGRYEAYINIPDEYARSAYCNQMGYSGNDISITDQNMGVLHNMITGRIQSKITVEANGLDAIIAAQEAQANDIADRFLKQLLKDYTKGE